MLLYLATAPLLPPCLKIAVNYKCSLNVSSDPEMQVGVRRRDSASPSLKRPRHDFSPLSSFSLSFLLSPPSSTSLSSPFTSPPILLLSFWGSSTVLSLHLWCSLTPLWHFIGTVGVSEATGIEGSSSFSPSHERAATRHWRPCETASVCRLYVRHTESLCISPQLPLLVQPQEWDVEREGM